MKNTVIAIISVLIMFTSSWVFAKGMSLGVFGAYTTDGGNIEDTIHDAEYSSVDLKMSVKNDPVMIPGMGFFARYEFKNNLFLRTGMEAYKMVSGGEIDGSDSTQNIEYKIDYFAATVPLYIGINVTPDKGKTSFYGAFGLVVAIIDIQWEKHIVMAGPVYYDYECNDDTMVTGFGGLLGAEKMITKSLYFMIEYALYKCEDTKKIEVEINNNGTPDKYETTNKFGLPRQQIRIGLRYDF